MAESLISNVIDQLLSILGEQAAGGFQLVRGVDEEVNKLTNNLQAIQAVIEDAERRQVQEVTVKKWLQDLKDVSYDIDDLLDEWNTSILKQKMVQDAEASVGDAFPPLKKVRYAIRNFSSRFCYRGDIASKIGELNGKLDEIASRRNRYNFKSGKGSREQRIITTSIIDVSEVFVREDDEKKIKKMLLCESSAETKNINIISILGMGGIGKTTLARLAFNDAEVESQFDERIWVCVSDPFEEERIAVEILESLRDRKPDLIGRDKILRDISESVSRKKVLLVLDDVWTEDSNDWEQLKASLQTCSRGSRILVTTRKEPVAKSMGSRKMDLFFLSELPDEKCWSLFARLAFFDRTIEECRNLENIGRKIVRKCKGLPLAVKVVGGLLRFKERKEEWQCILDSEMWEIEEVQKGVFPPLLLSYYDLPPVLKQCFSYCAIFPKDYVIEKEKLIYLWMSQGLLKETRHKKMEVVGEEYFNKLAMLSFFQDFMKDIDNTIHRFKIHDIVHDFAQLLTARECLLMEIDGVESRKKTCFESIRHLTMTGRNETVGISMEDCKKLRTLSIKKSVGLERILNSIDHLTCLRALDLNRSSCRMLTDKIGKLTRLRYLDLSGNVDLEISPKLFPPGMGMGMRIRINLPQSLDIRHCSRLKELLHGMGKLINLVYLNLSGNTDLDILPEAVCDLFSLRSLDISGWRRLKELPHGMGKLINLVYLNLSGNVALEILPEAVCDLWNLQRLDISCCNRLKELPHAMGKLINLVYLNLSSNVDLEILPEAVCDLCNLQRLNISCCSRLKELPHGMGKLINLVYLENFATPLRLMPKGMERLTSLRTLKEFVASSGDGSCSLDGLGKLTHLQGSLWIRRLGYIAESSKENKAILLAKTGPVSYVSFFIAIHQRQS